MVERSEKMNDTIIYEVRVQSNCKFDISTVNPKGKPYNKYDVPQKLLYFEMNRIATAVNNTLKKGCAFTIA